MKPYTVKVTCECYVDVMAENEEDALDKAAETDFMVSDLQNFEYEIDECYTCEAQTLERCKDCPFESDGLCHFRFAHDGVTKPELIYDIENCPEKVAEHCSNCSSNQDEICLLAKAFYGLPVSIYDIEACPNDNEKD